MSQNVFTCARDYLCIHLQLSADFLAQKRLLQNVLTFTSVTISFRYCVNNKPINGIGKVLCVDHVSGYVCTRVFPFMFKRNRRE